MNTKTCKCCGAKFHRLSSSDRQWNTRLFCSVKCRSRWNDSQRAAAEKKECDCCHQQKYLWQFKTVKRNKDGRNDTCKACITRIGKENRERENYVAKLPHLNFMQSIPIVKGFTPLIPTCEGYSESLRVHLDP